VAADGRLVKAAVDLIESDANRQPYTPTDDRLVVSPENAREVLEKFISGAKKTLSIYEMNLADRRMLKLLQERLKSGVEVRVIGKAPKLPEGIGLRIPERIVQPDPREDPTHLVGSRPPGLS